MRSSLLFNYILLVATNPLCSNPSTCFLRLAGTQRYVSCLPGKMCIIYIWPTVSFFLLCPWKSWTHTHAHPLSSETASTHLLTHRFRCGLNFVNLWNFSEDAHTRKGKCLQNRGFWGYIPFVCSKDVTLYGDSGEDVPCCKGIWTCWHLTLCPPLFGFVQEMLLPPSYQITAFEGEELLPPKRLLILVLVVLQQSPARFLQPFMNSWQTG